MVYVINSDPLNKNEADCSRQAKGSLVKKYFNVDERYSSISNGKFEWHRDKQDRDSIKLFAHVDLWIGMIGAAATSMTKEHSTKYLGTVTGVQTSHMKIKNDNPFGQAQVKFVASVIEVLRKAPK